MVLGPAIAAHKCAERIHEYTLLESRLAKGARAISTEDLRRQVGEYEGKKAYYDAICKEILEDELGEMIYHQRNLKALDCLVLLETNYEIQKRVLRERTASE